MLFTSPATFKQEWEQMDFWVMNTEFQDNSAHEEYDKQLKFHNKMEPFFEVWQKPYTMV